MQAAIVPLLVSAANVSGVQWDMVDGSSLATERTSSFQVCHVLRHQTENVLLLMTYQLHIGSCCWRTIKARSMHKRHTLLFCSSLFGEGLHEAGAHGVRAMVKSLLLTACRHYRLHGA